MRTGGSTVQQALSPEALNVVKQSVILAKRRGHAQVTPLHVANTLLSTSTGILRTACLRSHSHPLQCKALELCFNVALNRLPASNSSPMLSTHSHHPSISNALVAAFKRAQAHQRRGSIENQQQSLLAVKIEIEQLIISILDDPSVSRVMREAGFSSTQVKSNIEQAVPLEISNSQNIPPSVSSNCNPSGLKVDKQVVSSEVSVRTEDVMSVIEGLTNERNKRSFVVVGECISSIGSVIQVVFDKIEKRDVPEILREVKFFNVGLSGQFSRVEVELKLVEIKDFVRSCMGKGAILCLGDLKWTIEYKSGPSEPWRGYHCPVEHIIMELGKLVRGIGENGMLWVMGIATFQTFTRCKTECPLLETVLGLHPLTIPAGSLRLSLITDSGNIQYYSSGKNVQNGSAMHRIEQAGGEEQQLSCCPECEAKFEMEARSLIATSTSSLPAWLQQYKNEMKGLDSTYDQSHVQVSDLRKKWNSICCSIHQGRPNSSVLMNTFSFSSISPPSSTCFSYEQQYNTHKERPMFEFKPSKRDQHFFMSETADKNNIIEPTLKLYLPEHSNRPFPSNPNSASSSDVMDTDQYISRFKELNSENHKTLCNALEKKIPWQKGIIPDIATTILQCRSGMVKRKGKGKNGDEMKEETWFLFQGVDMEAKEKVARELARLVFGSRTNNFVAVPLSSFSSRTEWTEDCRNKRSRDEESCSYIERFAELILSNPHRVFLVEDVDQADYFSQIGFKRAIEGGIIKSPSGEEIGLYDAIIILSCESCRLRSRPGSPRTKQMSEGLEEEKDDCAVSEETSPCLSLDLNISIENDDPDDAGDQSMDVIGLLESVDRRIVFEIQEV